MDGKRVAYNGCYNGGTQWVHFLHGLDGYYTDEYLSALVRADVNAVSVKRQEQKATQLAFDFAE